VFCLSAKNSEKRIGKRVGYVQQAPAQLGAPDSVRYARLVRGELAALGIRRRHTAIIHRTAWWCTGLSGGARNCPVSQQSRAPTVGRTIFARHVDYSNSQLVHRTVRCAPDSLRCANQPRGATIRYAKFGRRSSTGPSTGPVWWRTGLSGAPLDRRQG
jgi:hypothetical protein